MLRPFLEPPQQVTEGRGVSAHANNTQQTMTEMAPGLVESGRGEKLYIESQAQASALPSC